MPLPKLPNVSKHQFLKFMESIAPGRLCEGWDNCGMLIDTGKTSFSRVLLALDATQAVAREAVERGCDLLLTHHPIMLKGIGRIAVDDPQGQVIATLLQGGVSHFAAHTNLDSAHAGVNAVLAQRLGLKNPQVLRASEFAAKKVVVYVPASHADVVFDAMSEAGAGKMGNYAKCCFKSVGMGSFLPLSGTNPTIGTVGSLESVEEIRLETIVPQANLGAVVNAMLSVHPYEEPAFDVFSTERKSTNEGLGRVGDLDASLTLAQFAEKVKRALGIDALRVAGDLTRMVKRVAVCGGSGADLLDDAIMQKADVFVTGDVKHHQALYGAEKGIALIDAGHYATEVPVIHALIECLQEQFDKVQYEIDFFISRAGASAMQSI